MPFLLTWYGILHNGLIIIISPLTMSKHIFKALLTLHQMRKRWRTERSVMLPSTISRQLPELRSTLCFTTLLRRLGTRYY